MRGPSAACARWRRSWPISAACSGACSTSCPPVERDAPVAFAGSRRGHAQRSCRHRRERSVRREDHRSTALSTRARASVRASARRARSTASSASTCERVNDGAALFVSHRGEIFPSRFSAHLLWQRSNLRSDRDLTVITRCFANSATPTRSPASATRAYRNLSRWLSRTRLRDDGKLHRVGSALRLRSPRTPAGREDHSTPRCPRVRDW